jgi:hypothetical protein
MCERVRALDYDARPAGLDNEHRLRIFGERYPENAALPREERRLLMFPALFGEISAPAMVDDVAAIAAGFRPDLFLHDAGEFAAPIVAAAHGKPNVTHGFGPVLPPDLVQLAADRVAPLWRAAGLEPRPFGGCYDHLYVDIYPPDLDATERPHLRDVQRLRPHTVDALPGERLPPRVQQLNAPIVYVSFGTAFNTPEAFAPVLEACARLDANILVTVGPGHDLEDYRGAADNVLVEEYVPQSLVFDRCAAVVSHAGSGTFLQAVSHGLPQLCVPQGADQYANAANGVRAGVALSIEPSAASPDRIAASIRELLDDQGFSTNAKRVAARIQAMPSPAEVAHRLAAMVGTASA